MFLAIAALGTFAPACREAPAAWDSALADATVDISDALSRDEPLDATPCGSQLCGDDQYCVLPCGCDVSQQATCGHCEQAPAMCGPLADCECLDALCPRDSLGCGAVDGRSVQCVCQAPPDAWPEVSESVDAAPACATLDQASCRVRPDCIVQCRPRCGCACANGACGCALCVGSCFFFVQCEAR